MFKTNKTSYLKKLENFISKNNIKLTGTETDQDVQSKIEHEKNEINEIGSAKDIVSIAEDVFGVKAQPLSPEEQRIHAQVADRALVYQIINGKPEILVYKKA